MSRAVTVVAPREVADYVTWAARVSGCHPGLAGRIGAAITFAELHHGDAVAVFVESLGDELHLSDLALAPDLVVSGEVAARGRGTGNVAFDVPVRFAALAKSLDDACSRGVVCADLPPAVGSRTEFTSLTLRRVAPGDPGPEGTLARRAEAADVGFQRGIAVDSAVWDRLVDAAKDFRVPESVLDAAEG